MTSTLTGRTWRTVERSAQDICRALDSDPASVKRLDIEVGRVTCHLSDGSASTFELPEKR